MPNEPNQTEADDQYMVYAIFLRSVIDRIQSGLLENDAVEYVLRTEYTDMDGALMNVEFDKQRRISHEHPGDLTSNVVLPLYLRYKASYYPNGNWSRSGEKGRAALDRIKAEFARQMTIK